MSDITKKLKYIPACCGITIASVLLAGCTTFRAPAIVDISDSKVVVQKTDQIGLAKNTATLQDVQKTANNGCGQYNKKAVLLSEVCGRMQQTQFGPICAATNYLFSCNEKEKKKKKKR